MIYIHIYLLVWLFTNFEPIQDLINKLFTDLIKPTIFSNIIFILLGCSLCLSFWLTLLITFNIWGAILSAIVAKIHKNLQDN